MVQHKGELYVWFNSDVVFLLNTTLECSAVSSGDEVAQTNTKDDVKQKGRKPKQYANSQAF